MQKPQKGPAERAVGKIRRRDDKGAALMVFATTPGLSGPERSGRQSSVMQDWHDLMSVYSSICDVDCKAPRSVYRFTIPDIKRTIKQNVLSLQASSCENCTHEKQNPVTFPRTDNFPNS